MAKLTVLIKGGGEVASGIAHKLFRARFRVCLTEITYPKAVSRGVAFSEAVYDGEKEIEGILATLIKSTGDIPKAWEENKLPIIVDPETKVRDKLHPDVLVDAIMANNSENTGKVIFEGEAEKNTGVPIPIMGLSYERVIHAPKSGLFLANKDIGEIVAAGEVVGKIDEQYIKAPIDGVIRAMIRSGIEVKEGIKLGEVDPTGNIAYCYTIRAKMRAIAGGVLEAILTHFNV
jgi:xanthine dehydrogenase accessory factor